jgi:quercetin dioxygenase-like cupin family protein
MSSASVPTSGKQDEQADRPRHAPGATTGSPQRPAQQLTGEALVFDLAQRAEQLRREPAWERGGRNAITLAKEGDLRVVLTVLRAGSRLREHAVEGPFTIQTISGRVRLQLPDRGPEQAIELSAGQLAAVARGLAHDVEALEESAFLLTIRVEKESATR